MKQDKYIENTLIKLKRLYSKDETVAMLSKNNSALAVENGKLQSEIDELKHAVKKLTEVGKEVRDRAKRLQYFKNLKEEMKSLRKLNKERKIENERLTQKLIARENL